MLETFEMYPKLFVVVSMSMAIGWLQDQLWQVLIRSLFLPDPVDVYHECLRREGRVLFPTFWFR